MCFCVFYHLYYFSNMWFLPVCTQVVPYIVSMNWCIKINISATADILVGLHRWEMKLNQSIFPQTCSGLPEILETYALTQAPALTQRTTCVTQTGLLRYVVSIQGTYLRTTTKQNSSRKLRKKSWTLVLSDGNNEGFKVVTRSQGMREDSWL